MVKNLIASYKTKNVSIRIEKGLFFSNNFTDLLRKYQKKVVLFVDSNILQIKLYNERISFLQQETDLDIFLVEVSAKEKDKNKEQKDKIENLLINEEINKDSIFVAIGGGIVSDLVGFIASTYCRGVNYIIIPTTLLAMVDASVGGKNGINTNERKNFFGTIYHSDHILVDPTFLESLDRKQMLNGYSEIIKYALLFDKDLYNTFLNQDPMKIDLEQIIYKCLKYKIDVTEKDENDENERQILNFGHTIAHSLEINSSYQISHGEAVSIGIIAAAFLSPFEKKDMLEIMSIFKKMRYPLTFSNEISWREILNHLSFDKKSINKSPRFILLEKIGAALKKDKSFLQNIDEKKVKQMVIWLEKRFRGKKESV